MALFQGNSGNGSHDNQVTEAPSYLIPEYMTPLTRTGYTITAIYLTFLGIVATVGNVAVICVLCRYGTFRKRAINLLLINMAVSDLGVSFFGYPLTTMSGYWGRWLFGDVGCQFYAFCVYTLSCSTITTHAVIAIYRFVYIVKTDYRPKLTMSFSTKVIAGIWLYSLFWTVTPLIGWSSYVYEPFGTSCSVNWFGRTFSDISYMVACTFGVYLLQIIIMMYCYTRVARKIRGINPERTEERDVGVVMFGLGKLRNRDSKIDNHVTKMCFMMMVSFIIVWAPYAVECLWAAHVKRMSALASVLPTMFAKSSCMINPLIFLASSSKFRRDLSKLWSRPTTEETLATGRKRSVEQRSFFVRQSALSNPSVSQSASVYYDKERIFIGDMSASRIQKEAELLHRDQDVLSIASSSSDNSDVHFVVKQKKRHKPDRYKAKSRPSGPKGPEMFLASGSVTGSQSTSSTGDSKNMPTTSSGTSGTGWSRRSGIMIRKMSRRDSMSTSENAGKSAEIFTLEGAMSETDANWKL